MFCVVSSSTPGMHLIWGWCMNLKTSEGGCQKHFISDRDGSPRSLMATAWPAPPACTGAGAGASPEVPGHHCVRSHSADGWGSQGTQEMGPPRSCVCRWK